MADAENPQEFASILCDPLIFRFLLHLVKTADTSLDSAGKLMQGLQRSMSSAVFGLGKPGGSFETGAAQPTLLGYEHERAWMSCVKQTDFPAVAALQVTSPALEGLYLRTPGSVSFSWIPQLSLLTEKGNQPSCLDYSLVVDMENIMRRGPVGYLPIIICEGTRDSNLGRKMLQLRAYALNTWAFWPGFCSQKVCLGVILNDYRATVCAFSQRGDQLLCVSLLSNVKIESAAFASFWNSISYWALLVTQHIVSSCSVKAVVHQSQVVTVPAQRPTARALSTETSAAASTAGVTEESKQAANIAQPNVGYSSTMRVMDGRVYKVFDYRERSVLPEDQRWPELSLKHIPLATLEYDNQQPMHRLSIISYPFIQGDHVPQTVNDVISVLEAVNNLHADSVIHGDIRWMNVLLRSPDAAVPAPMDVDTPEHAGMWTFL